MKTTNTILLWSCVATVVSARFETSTDHTALLQSQVGTSSSTAYQAATELFPSLTSLSDPKSGRAALAQIERAVISMKADKSQITESVAGIVSGVIDMLDELITKNTTVDGFVGKILSEHAVDQGDLDSKVVTLNQVDLHLDAKETARQARNATIWSEVATIASCHISSTASCLNVSECTGEVQAGTTAKSEAGVALHEIDIEINEYQCLGQHNDVAHNHLRNDSAFREHSASLYSQYIIALNAWNSTDDDLEELEEECEITQSTYVSHLTDCATDQINANSMQCDEFKKMRGHLVAYMTARVAAEQSFRDDRVATMLRESDRRVEYDVVTRVVCLLGTLIGHTEDGDVAGAPNVNEIEDCKDMPVDTTHLNIAYPVQQGVINLPSLPVFPCNSDFETQVSASGGCGYSTLPPTIINIDNNLAVNASSYYAGVDVDCACEVAEDDEDYPTWNDALTDFVLVDAHVDHTRLIISGSTWEYTTLLDEKHSGEVAECSSCNSWCSESSSEWFGTAATTMCHLYAGEQDIVNAPPGSSQSMERYAWSHGGFAYKDSDGNVVGFRTWAPIAGTLAQPPSHILKFAQSTQPASHPGPFKACTADICPVGASTFIWITSPRNGIFVNWPDGTTKTFLVFEDTTHAD